MITISNIITGTRLGIGLAVTAIGTSAFSGNSLEIAPPDLVILAAMAFADGVLSRWQRTPWL